MHNALKDDRHNKKIKNKMQPTTELLITQIQIYNALGEKLFESDKLVYEINISTFSKGIYFMKVGGDCRTVIRH